MHQPLLNETGAENIICEEIITPVTLSRKIRWEVMRLDQIHPIISGNKWYKLKYPILDARKEGYHSILTFGGPWSNHILASAYAASQAVLKSIGIIRGEQPARLSDCLQDAVSYGMKLHFVSRSTYMQRNDLMMLKAIAGDMTGVYVIPEGGYCLPGVKGVTEWARMIDIKDYSHICCACGTGTFLAGLVGGTGRSKTCIGISVLKGQEDLQERILGLLQVPEQVKEFQILKNYHFGGYARKDETLIAFMNEFYRTHRIPTDFVYTGKLMFAINHEIENGLFPVGSHVLAIHSGGLQGNRSLEAGALEF